MWEVRPGSAAQLLNRSWVGLVLARESLGVMAWSGPVGMLLAPVGGELLTKVLILRVYLGYFNFGEIVIMLVYICVLLFLIICTYLVIV